MVHEACGHGLEADFILKSMSVYSGKLGETVASPLISVVDDGTLANRRGSSAMDDEGIPTTRAVLIDKGVLQGYLHSRRTARLMKMRPTGHGRRESYRHLPLPRMRRRCAAAGGATSAPPASAQCVSVVRRPSRRHARALLRHVRCRSAMLPNTVLRGGRGRRRSAS